MKPKRKLIGISFQILSLLLLIIGHFFVGCRAETSSPRPSETNQIDFSQKRRDVIRQNLQLTPEISKRFWPLYDHYQTQLDIIRQKRREVLFDLGQGLDGMSEDEAREYVMDKLALEEKRAQVTREYFKRLAEFMSYRNLALYIQLENKIRVFVEAGIEEAIPLIH